MPLSIKLDVIALVGIAILSAFLVGQVLKRLGIPQVVGFILGGVLLGPSLFHLIPNELNVDLSFVSEMALGLIGFDMGGHLRFSKLRKMGGSILLIVILEALGAFLLVGGALYLITGSVYLALVFGALASATDPASTVDVLNEYHADGPLTTRLLAVVGLDDAISLLLFSLGAALVESHFGSDEGMSVLVLLGVPLLEIGGSLLLGLALGIVLHWAIRYLKIDPHTHDAMVVPIGTIFVASGLARALGLSLTLTMMVIGLVVVNRNAYNGLYIRATIERAGPVIYLLFFALAGARLNVLDLPAMGLVGIAYLVFRNLGKLAGAWAGGVLGKCDRPVRNNLGLALFSQAGIVIGLALDSHIRFGTLGAEGERLGNLILTVITATTVVAQLLGPIFVKLAITRAGEARRSLDRLVAE
ncbi:MAG: hypothetical protein Kow00124_10630 [Anaerolineae bacterium]